MLLREGEASWGSRFSLILKVLLIVKSVCLKHGLIFYWKIVIFRTRDVFCEINLLLNMHSLWAKC